MNATFCARYFYNPLLLKTTAGSVAIGTHVHVISSSRTTERVFKGSLSYGCSLAPAESCGHRKLICSVSDHRRLYIKGVLKRDVNWNSCVFITEPYICPSMCQRLMETQQRCLARASKSCVIDTLRNDSNFYKRGRERKSCSASAYWLAIKNWQFN